MARVIEETQYRFSELDERAQERAIANMREQMHEWTEPDELRDDDYWQETLFTPNGFIVDERRYQTMGGQTRSEPAIYWSSYPWHAYFEADVDIEQFILGNKLGNQYRTLLNHARNTGGVGVRVGEPERRSAYCDVSVDYYDATDAQIARLNEQANAIEEDILDTYRDVAGEIAKHLEANLDWLTSEENARERLQDDDLWFDEDGNELD